jgi:hypothetical protein
MNSSENILQEQEIERILTSFIQSRNRQERECSLEECQELINWAVEVVVNYTTLQLLLKGHVEIEDFDGDDVRLATPENIQFHTPLMNQIAKQIEELQ